MESLTVVAVSTDNLFDEPELAIKNMETWLQRAAEQTHEVFNHLNLIPEIG